MRIGRRLKTESLGRLRVTLAVVRGRCGRGTLHRPAGSIPAAALRPVLSASACSITGGVGPARCLRDRPHRTRLRKEMAREHGSVPMTLVIDRTFPFAFPEIACEEKGMGKGMRGKGMGTDRRFDSLARTFLCRNRPCAFRLRRRRIVVGIDHRAGNCRHFRGAVGWPSTGWATVAHSRASRGRTIQWTGAAETTGDVAAFHSRRPRDAGRPVAPNTVALIACLRCLI